MTLTPSPHDFGKVVLGASAVQSFLVTGMPIPSDGRLKVVVTGPDAAEFAVDTGTWVPAAAGPVIARSTCNGIMARLTGSCVYRVDFKPRSVGRKSARLVVDDNGVLATAPLTGEGIVTAVTSATAPLDCVPVLVSCNYAKWYSGQYSVDAVDSTTFGNPNRRMRNHTTTDVFIEKGSAWCSGSLDEWEEEWNGRTLMKRTTTHGYVHGPGLFAVEFRGLGPAMEYTMKFVCPSATITTTTIDYIAKTTDTGHVPSEPAEWRHAGLAADPQRATQLVMVDLAGLQLDRIDGAPNDWVGYAAMRWTIKRWR